MGRASIVTPLTARKLVLLGTLAETGQGRQFFRVVPRVQPAPDAPRVMMDCMQSLQGADTKAGRCVFLQRPRRG